MKKALIQFIVLIFFIGISGCITDNSPENVAIAYEKALDNGDFNRVIELDYSLYHLTPGQQQVYIEDITSSYNKLDFSEIKKWPISVVKSEKINSTTHRVIITSRPGYLDRILSGFDVRIERAGIVTIYYIINDEGQWRISDYSILSDHEKLFYLK